MPKLLGARLILLGFFLAAGCGLPIVFRLLHSVPRATVTACKTSWSHKYYALVSLDSGRELSLTENDIPDPKACLRVGSMVEKRRFELWYRLDGTAYRSYSQSWAVVPALAGCGLLLVLLGFLLRTMRR